MTTTASILKDIKQREAYQKYIDTAFSKIDVKPKTSVSQVVDDKTVSSDLRLQINIANGHLTKTMPNKPILVKDIIDYLSEDEQQLNDFNKYFNVLELAVKWAKINTLDDFINEWSLFKTKDLGKLMTESSKDTVGSIYPSSRRLQEIEAINTASNEVIDNWFKKAIEYIYDTPNYKTVNNFRYPLKQSTYDNLFMSSPIKIVFDGDKIIFIGPTGRRINKHANFIKEQVVKYQREIKGKEIQGTGLDQIQYKTLKKSFKITKWP